MRLETSVFHHILMRWFVFPPRRLGGVMIAYNNVRLLSSHGNILDDQPYLHFDVQTDYIIFQPTVGSIVKGCVNHIGKGHIGCLVHDCFNGAVPQPWDSGDTWPGNNLDNGQEFLFEVDQIHTQNGILSMRGKLIDSRSVEGIFVRVFGNCPQSKYYIYLCIPMCVCVRFINS